jgi:hypothetical protein
MTSHVMLSNGAAYILDCGLGVTDRFAETGTPFNAVRSIFITHHHPDHNCEYGPFLLVGWVNGLRSSVRSYGPPPLKEMTEDLFRAYRTTIVFWAEDFKMVPLSTIDVNEVPGAGDCLGQTWLRLRHRLRCRRERRQQRDDCAGKVCRCAESPAHDARQHARANGCLLCHHRAVLAVDRWPDHVTGVL